MLATIDPVAVRRMIRQAGLRSIAGIGMQAAEAGCLLPVMLASEEGVDISAGDEMLAAA